MIAIFRHRRKFRIAAVLGVLVGAMMSVVLVWALFSNTSPASPSTFSAGSLTAPNPAATAPTAGQAHVVWTAVTSSPDDPSVDSQVTYLVERSDDGGGSWSATNGTCGPAAAPNGTTSCDDSPTPGDYEYRVTAMFHSWKSAGTTATVTVVSPDSVPPNSSIAFPGALAYNAAGWTAGCSTSGTDDICGSASDPGAGASGVNKVQVRIERSSDGKFWNGTAGSWVTGLTWNDATGTTTWSYGFSGSNLANGVSYTVQSQATDNATNVQTTPDSKTFVYDTTPPSVTITKANGSPVGFPYSSNAYVATIGGACGDSSPGGDSGTVDWSVSGDRTESGTATCSAGGWTATLTPEALPNGSFTVSATESDAAGNTGSSGDKAITVSVSIPPYATPGTYTITIPAGVTVIPFTLVGGGGGSTGSSTGGSGGTIQGTITLDSNPTGTTLKAIVGGGNSGNTGGGGYGNGGAGGSSSAAGGGGASAIETAGGTPLVIASGGGGAGQTYSGNAGGFGGGGGVPLSPYTLLTNVGATGGTGSGSNGGAGGAGGSTDSSGIGTNGAGGASPNGTTGGSGFFATTGGGGGGGYAGGEGGGSCGLFCGPGGGGGGGGSSFTGGSPPGYAVTITSATSNSGNGGSSGGDGGNGSAQFDLGTFGPPTHLVFTSQPASGVAGTALSTQPTVAVEDLSGNVVATYNGPIALAIGTNPSGGTLTCTANPVNAVSGVATFAGCRIDKGGVGYTLHATAGSLTAADSSAFTVNQAPAFTSANNATFTVGTLGSFNVTTSGVPAVGTITNTSSGGCTKSPSLPGTVAFHDNGDGTATISGTASSGTGGAYTLCLNATNGVNPAGTQTFTLTVDQAPAITSAGNATFEVGSSGSFAVTATGSPAPTFSETGALPGGVTLLPGGTLSGTPDAGTSGTYPITITATNGVSPNATQSFTLTVKNGTATAVVSSANPSVVGQQVTYTATVTPTAAGTPTGTVTFKDGAGTITCGGGSSAFDGSSATCTQTYASVSGSPHSITAVYGGDASFGGSTSPPVSQVVNAADTTTALTSATNPTVSGQATLLTGTVTASAPGGGTPGGHIEFLDGATPIAACGGAAGVAVNGSGVATCSPSFTATVSAHSLTAQYLGAASYNGSTSSPVSQTVNPADTTTTLTSGTNPAVTGQATLLTGAVTASVPGGGTPGGYVEFLDGATPIAACGGAAGVAVNGSGVATCSSSFTRTGSPDSLTAKYIATAAYNASTSLPVSQTTSKASTTTAVSSSANLSVFGQPVTLTATIAAASPGAGAPSGTVNFKDGGSTITGCGSQMVGGAGPYTATCTTSALSVATHSTITAVYSGDGDFLTSTSSNFTQTVNRASTTTAVSSSANPSVLGQLVTFTATIAAVSPGAGAPSGSVNFKDGGSTITGCGLQTVGGAGPYTATCTTSALSVATHSTITAVYSGDTHFSGSTSSNFTQTVNKASTATTLTSATNPSVTGQATLLTGTVSVSAPGGGTPSGNIEFLDGGTPIAACGGASGQPVAGGGAATCSPGFDASGSPHSLTAHYLGDVGYEGSTSSTVSQTVTGATTTTAVSSSTDPSTVGQQVTYTATVAVTAPGAGTPGGSVMFKEGAATIACESGSAAFDGTSATCNVTYASTADSPHSITAVYDGDTNYTTSTSTALSQTVNAPSGPIWVATGSTDSGRHTGSGSGNVNLTPGTPSGTQAGDFMLLVVANTYNRDANQPTGWTPVASPSSTSGSDMYLSVFYRFYVAGDTSPTVSVRTDGGGASARIVSYRNVDTTTPLDGVTPDTATGTSIPFGTGSLMTNTANDLAVSIVAENDGSSSPPSLGLSSANGFVEETGFPDPPSVGDSGNHHAVDVASEPIPVAGTINFPTYTTDANGVWAGVSIALRPAPAPAANVVFTTQPTDTAAGATITPPVQVSVEDAYGNVETADNSTQVTVAIGSNAGPGTLYGTLTRTVSDGVATFDDLSINNTGTGYTLTTASTGLTGDTSSAFNIDAAPVVVSASLLTSTDDAASSSGHTSTTTGSIPTTNGATELILVHRHARSSDSITSITGPFTGLTQINSTLNYESGWYVWAYWATGNGSTGTVTVNFSAGNYETVVNVVQLSGNNTTTPIAQSHTNSGSSSPTIGSLTSPNAANGEIEFVGVDGGSGTVLSTPSGITKLDGHDNNFMWGSFFTALAQATESGALNYNHAWGAIAIEINHG